MFSCAAQWNAVCKKFLEFWGWHQTRPCAFGRKRSWRNGVQANAVLAPFCRQGFGQADHARFGNGTGDNVPRTSLGVGGGNVQNHAFVFCRNPAFPKLERAVKRSVQNDIQYSIHGAVREAFGGGYEISCGVVQECIHMSKFSFNRIHHRGHGIWITHITLHR